MEKRLISIVVPMYNEEKVVKECYARLLSVVQSNDLNYEIILYNQDPILINFYDNAIQIGEEFYLFNDADKIRIPQQNDATIIWVGSTALYKYSEFTDINDIIEINTLLSASVADIPVINSISFDQESNHIYVYFFGNYDNYFVKEYSFYVKEYNGKYLLHKNFHTSYSCIGELSYADYETLMLACKGQFGTYKHFSVTSGDKTIYPAGFFRRGYSYDEETGTTMHADGFTQFYDWTDYMETLYYEPNFSFWIKDTENTKLDLLIAGTYENLSIEEIKELPEGEYIIECQLTSGDIYVMSEYKNSVTHVYWFVLVKNG